MKRRPNTIFIEYFYCFTKFIKYIKTRIYYDLTFLTKKGVIYMFYIYLYIVIIMY